MGQYRAEFAGVFDRIGDLTVEWGGKREYTKTVKMTEKTELIMDGYFDILEKVKERIVEERYKVMTTTNVERNILCSLHSFRKYFAPVGAKIQ